MGIHNLAIVFPQFIVSMLSQAAAGLANSRRSRLWLPSSSSSPTGK